MRLFSHSWPGKAIGGLLIAASGLSAALQAATWDVPAAHRVDWSGTCGIPGGIPVRSTINTTISAGASLTTINNAIAACPSGQVVLLSAGTYTLTGSILLNKDGVELRGAGRGQTIINSSANICVTSNDYNWFGGRTARTISSGATKGSTSVVVAAGATDFLAGELMQLDCADDTALVMSVSGPGRNLGFTTMCTGVSGSTISFSPALPYDLTSTPQAKGNAYSPSGSTSGIASMTINSTAGAASVIENWNTYQFYVYDCELTGAGNAFVQINDSVQTVVKHCTIHGAEGFATDNNTDGFGVYAYTRSSHWLIEDNIFYDLWAGVFVTGAGPGAVLYNFVTNCNTFGSDRQQSGMNSNHGPHPMMILWEGNSLNQWTNDAYHGTASHQTIFRNWIHGIETGRMINIKLIDAGRGSYYHYVVGNVLGSTDLVGLANFVYSFSGDAGTSYTDTKCIYRLGYPNVGNNNTAETVDNAWQDDYAITYPDAQVAATMYRHRNYDYFNQSITNTGGEETSLPNSLFYAAKPTFFGSLAWPAYSPDSPGSADVQDIPAGYRYVNGQDPPTNATPTPSSAAINAAGTSLTLTFSEAVTRNAATPTVSLSGGACTLTYSSGSGTSAHVYTTSRTVYQQETGTLSATLSAGNWTDADTNSVETFSGLTIANSSTQDNTPPVAASAAISATGSTLTLTLNEATTRTAAVPTLSFSGGASTATYVSGSGSTALVFSLSRRIRFDESGTVGATLSAGNWTDAAGNSVVTFSGLAVTNSSTYPFPTVAITQGPAEAANSTTHNLTIPTASSTQAVVVAIQTDGSATFTTPTNWTSMATSVANGSATRQAWFRRIGAFTGGTVNFATSANERTAAIILLIDEWGGTASYLALGTAATGSSTSPNPPTATAGTAGSANIYVAIAGYDIASGTPTLTVAPTNFGSITQRASTGTGSAGLGVATRSLQSDSLDPAVFTLSTSQAWVAQTLVISGVSSDTTAPTITGITVAASGDTVTLATSETVTTGAGGNGTATISMSGGAATLTITSVAGSTITATSSRTIRKNETGTGGYTQPTNGVEDTSGNDLATVSGITVTNNSTSDVTAPTPDPSTFATAPTAVSSTAVRMIATTATDADTGPVFYDFDQTSGSAGGTDSGQQTSATYVDSGLSASTLYTYRLRVFDSASPQNNTTYSSGNNVTTMALPATPTGFTATAVSQTQINLAWTDAAVGETGYLVYRATTTGFTPGAGNLIATLAAGSVAYSDTTLQSATQYFYTVKAYRDPTIAGPPTDLSAAATEANDTTDSDVPPPAPRVRRPHFPHRSPGLP